MKQFLSFVQKEFYHILRDRRTLLVIIGMPVVQILLFGFAINTEVSDLRVVIYAPEIDGYTHEVAQLFEHNSYFAYKGFASSITEVEEMMRQERLDLAIIFESNFQELLTRGEEPRVQLLANSSDPNRGSIAIDYAQAILARHFIAQEGFEKLPFQVEASTRMVYNPEMKSAYLFVPGIIGLVLMLISTLMTAVSIVREKERGTMEVLLASPLKPGVMVVAKTIPYLLISLVNLASILLLSYFVLEVPIRGSLLLLIGVSLLFIFLGLSMGLAISNLVESQINAIIFSAILVIVSTLVFSGMIFPVENMPLLLRLIGYITPATWFISAVRKVMIQGLGLGAIGVELMVLVGMTLFLLLLTILTSKKRLE